jgi:ectoine hydroxylase-related dioxygenase (phytanoyl-CoA dioxygenase family)
MPATAPLHRIEDALAQCGVTATTLTPAEQNALDRLGYLVLLDIIDRTWLAQLRAVVEAALDQGQRHGQHIHLPWTDPVFDGVYTHPKVLAAVYQVLRRPFRVCGVTARAPAPGQGLQGLHMDFPRAPSEPFRVVTALWLLDDFTANNGATRLVPGSHRMPNALPKRLQQPESRHPDQQLILARAGAVLVFNGHLWHSGTRNETDGPRRALQGHFRPRELTLLGEERPDLPERLSAAARYLLGEDGNGEQEVEEA